MRACLALDVTTTKAAATASILLLEAIAEHRQSKGDVMASLNKVYSIGYLGQRFSLQYTRDGRPACRLSVATDERSVY